MPRSPEYNRNTVIAQATEVFWARGYAKTSVGDLVDATGLQPGSLYAAFGSKKGVFLEVLDDYNRGFIAGIRELIELEGSRTAAIRGILDDIVEAATSGNGRKGCLTVNAMLEMSQHDEDIARHLDAHNRGIRKAFARLIRAAQQRHELPARKDANAMAAFLVNSIWGLRVSCKGNPDRAGLEATVESVMLALESA